jgi:hypothetical protein
MGVDQDHAELGPAFLDRRHDRRLHVVPDQESRAGTLSKTLVKIVPLVDRESEPRSQAIQRRAR